MSTNNKLYREVLKKLQLSKHNYEIGLFKEKGKYSDGKYVAEVGFDNNYGTGIIPARPFLYEGAKKNEDKAIRVALLEMSNTLNEENALKKASKVLADGIKEYITELSTPPNAPSTIARKGSSNPLIDTGRMRNSIDYREIKKNA